MNGIFSKFALGFALFSWAGIILGQQQVSTPLQETLEAFPGDRFYVEGKKEAETVIKLTSRIESKMPGSMRLPFWFSIEATELRASKLRDGWSYYAAPEGRARAWHGMLGNVLGRGDTVGIRSNQENGELQWFVDNSYHNGFTTIWNRKVKKEEMPLVSFDVRSVVDPDSPLRALQYLGTRDGQLRIRYTKSNGYRTETEEFLFPIEGQLPMTIGVMGLRADVLEIAGSSMKVRIDRGFDETGFADLLSPTPED